MKKDRRRPIAKELQVLQTPAHQKYMMEAYLDGVAINTISRQLGIKTKREQRLHEKEGSAVRTKVYKLVRGYKGLHPLYSKLMDRTGVSVRKREIALIKVSMKYKKSISYISWWCGWSEKDVKRIVNKLRGGSKPKLF